MHQSRKFVFKGKIKVADLVENSDGSARVIFEADDDFKQSFKNYYGLKRWSQKRFNLFLQTAIEDMNKLCKEGLLEAKLAED